MGDGSVAYLVCLTPCVERGCYFSEAQSIGRLLSTIESLALSIPFAVSHNFEGSERFPLGTPEKHDSVDWYKSQVRP
jgi:hypothetical protein